MLGQPIYMLMPEVVGFKLTGQLPEGATATDLVLTRDADAAQARRRRQVRRVLRRRASTTMPLADRATIANMAPEYGATIGFFPVDDRDARATCELTGRDAKLDRRSSSSTARHQGLLRASPPPTRVYSDDAGARSRHGRAVARRPEAAAGPRRARATMKTQLAPGLCARRRSASAPRRAAVDEGMPPCDTANRRESSSTADSAAHGAVVIAAITSCTNTSQPRGDDRRRPARAEGARSGASTRKPWVKTSRSRRARSVVTEYLDQAGLDEPTSTRSASTLVGYGCTTCIGNSGPLPDPIAEAVDEGRSRRRGGAVGQPQLRGPREPAREGELPRRPAARRRLRARRHGRHRPRDRAARHGQRRRSPCSCSDIWPTQTEIADADRSRASRASSSSSSTRTSFAGPEEWQAIQAPSGDALPLGRRRAPTSRSRRSSSTCAPSADADPADPRRALLARLGDSVTTDHISPAGSIKATRPAGAVPAGARRRAGRLQQLRRAPRQRPRDDARHVRQHPPPEPARARHRGRRHDRLHLPDRLRSRGCVVHLRRVGEVPGGRHPAGRARRARTTAWARRATGRRRARTCSACARSSPSSFERIHRQQPRRHGRAAALQFQAGRDAARRWASTAPRPSTSRLDDDDRAAPDDRRSTATHPTARRRRFDDDLPHRHAGGGRVLPQRRHPAHGAAEDGPKS